MATKLIFKDLLDETELECAESGQNSIFITINNSLYSSLIELDKSTAIKLVKTLKSEISKIK